MIGSPYERRKAEDLAARLQVVIPGDSHIVFWSLHLLEAMVDRIEKLERQTLIEVDRMWRE
jgi:hypothetical protein